MRKRIMLTGALASVLFTLVLAFLWSSWYHLRVRTDLWLAAENGEVERLRRELEHQPLAVNEKDTAYGDRTLLHAACDRGQAEVVCLLLNLGADPNALDWNQRTPIMNAVSAEAPLDRVLLCIHLLLKAKAEIGLQDDQGQDALSIAIGTHKPVLVARLLDSGAPLNRQLFTESGWTPLHWACAQEESSNGNLEIVELLLDGGADLHTKDKSGRTPLDLARSRRSSKMEKRLLDWEKRPMRK